MWEVSVTDGEYDSYLIRGWQDMLNFVRDHMEHMLENADTDAELADEGKSVTVKLREMTRGRYDEITDNS